MSKGPDIVTFDLTVERPHLPVVLELMLHTILFHRTPGSILPTSLDAYEITFPAVDSPEIRELVESKVAEAEREVKRNKAQVVILFHEKRPPTAPKPRPTSAVAGITTGLTGWFAARSPLSPTTATSSPSNQTPHLEYGLPWEAYVLNLTLPSFTPSVSRAAAERLLRRQLSGFVLKVVEWTTGGRETPTITSQEVMPWPVRILINPPHGSVGFSIPDSSRRSQQTSFPTSRLTSTADSDGVMPLLKAQVSEPV